MTGRVFRTYACPRGTNVIVTNAAEAEVILHPAVKLRILKIEDPDSAALAKVNERLDIEIGERVIAEVVLE